MLCDSGALRKVIDENSYHLHVAVQAFSGFLEDFAPNSVSQFLYLSYHTTKYTVPSLTVCISTFDGVWPEMASFLRSRRSSELGHDALMMRDIDKFTQPIPPAWHDVIEYTDRVYSKIYTECGTIIGAIRYLGYMYLAEYRHITPDIVTKLERIACIPERSLRSLWIHAEDDAAHLNEQNEFLDNVAWPDALKPLRKEMLSAVREYQFMLADCLWQLVLHKRGDPRSINSLCVSHENQEA